MTVRKSTKYIVIHVTATPPNRDIGAKEVDAMHKARGWSGIGYHYVIRRDGTVEKGRPENRVGAHVAGFNSISLGISLVGGVDANGKPEDNRTGEQTGALRVLLRDLTKKYPDATICGHRDLSPDRDKDGVIEPHEYLKACPCFDAIPWANENNLPGAPIRGAWGSTGHGNKAGMIQQKPASPDSRNLYLQRLLKSAGYEFGPVDGIVGKKTKAAITRFQKAATLPETGEFDAPTVAKLRYMFETPMKEVAIAAQTMASPRPSPPGIKATPSKLRELGSRTIANADAGQIATGITAMTGVIGIASEVAKAAKSAQGVFAELIAVWPYALILAAAIFAYLAFRTAKRIRVEEHNEGVNINRRVLADAMDDELVADVVVNLVTRQ